MLIAKFAFTVTLAVGCDYAATDGATVTAKTYSRSRDPNKGNDVLALDLKFGQFLGMEDPERPWVMSYTNGAAPAPMTTARHSEGSYALDFSCGYSAFESPRFHTLELGRVSDTLEVDVFVPDTGASLWGDLQLSVDIPSAGVWNAWVAYKPLAELNAGSWATVSFSLPPVIQEALEGAHPHARFRFALNHGLCGETVSVDNLRFGGAQVCQELPASLPPVTSSSVLTFDRVSDWNSQAALASDSTQKTEGSASLKFGPASWTALESREFQAAELAGAGRHFSVDVFVPELSQDYHWLGGLNAYVECPASGLYRTFLGYRALQILTERSFNRVTFELPESVVTQLSTQGSACRFRFEVTQNTGYFPLALDNGGFYSPEDE